MPKLVPSEEQRQKLRRPLGELVTGDYDKCIRTLRGVLESESPPQLLLIGDTVSRTAVHAGIRPDLMIVDQKEMRGEAVPFSHSARHIFRTTNAAGTIDLIAWKAIEEAVTKRDSIVYVDGEEDLLTLVAILVAPLGSLVAYGQPKEGIVLVRVTAQKKKQIERMMDDFEEKN